MKNTVQNKVADQNKRGALGTFSGVFTPSIMTILGIILFLRLGYVVGSAGLGRALMIIGLANIISVLTSVSLSAIATNMKVKGGGDYYLISRTLGIEFGGAIGIVLFLAQSVSIAFYCIGFGEVFSGILQEFAGIPSQFIAAIAVLFLFVFAYLGSDWATRFQYVVMTFLVFALFSFFTGGLVKWEASVLIRNWAAPADGPGFWILFGLFFPAVTGFTQGVSMSGDLKDAGKSLPLGTFLAVGLSIIIYLGIAIIFAGALPQKALTTDYKAMWHVSRYGFLIDAGVIAATLSSAMASFLGAPRILQSLSGDRIFPFISYFERGYGSGNNPRRAVILSSAIAFGTIALGNLNVIAPIVSMFFLISYGLLNYATFFEAKSSSPSFRPRFRWFDYRLSFLGCLACLVTMLAIDLTSGAIAVSVLFGIFQYLKRTAGPARWADSRRSHHLQQVRENLLAADEEPEHPRDWRPQILAISDDAQRREQLLHFASWIQGGSGLITAARIMEGEGLRMLWARRESEDELRKDITSLDIHAFPLVLLVPRFDVGLHTLIQAYGIGPIRANTILLNCHDEFSKDAPSYKKITQVQNLRTVFRLNCSIIMLNSRQEAWDTLEAAAPENRRIDVWWWNDATSRLMLLLAYLMTRDAKWTGVGIRVLAVSDEKRSSKTLEDLENTLEEIRIEAEPVVLENPTVASVSKYSEDASMVFFPFQFRGKEISVPFDAKIEELLAKLPICAMVLAAEDIDLDAEPEEGKPREIAEALDAIEEALKRSHETEKNAEKAAKAAVDAENKLNKMIEDAGPGVDREIMGKIEKAAKAVDLAQEKADKASKKAASAQARAQKVAQEAEKLGIVHKEKDNQTSESSESE